MGDMWLTLPSTEAERGNTWAAGVLEGKLTADKDDWRWMSCGECASVVW